MNRIFLVLSAFLMAVPVSAALKKTKAPFQYVGSISINPRQDAKILADWYERFGVPTSEIYGGHYADFQTDAGEFAFGIHPRGTADCSKSTGSVAVVLQVSNYDVYLANAAKKNVVPICTESDPKLGRFAHFIDPDGNEMTVWGK